MQVTGDAWRARIRARLGWACWLFLAAVVLWRTWDAAVERRSVVRHYRAAAERWVAGEPLYAGDGRGFLYLPVSAVLHVPFAKLPADFGGALWRIVNLAVFAAGVRRLAALVAQDLGRDPFLLLSLVGAYSALAGTRHGQATLAMGGFVFLAADALARRRWSAGATWLGLGLAVKPLTVVGLLLAAGAWRPARIGALLAFLAVLALPFVTQAPAYAWEQTVAFVRQLPSSSNPAGDTRFPDAFEALTYLGVHLPEAVATAIRVLAGALTLAALVWVRRRARADRAALVFAALTVGYLLLMNPRTEHNSYALLAPLLAAFAALAWATPHSRPTALALLAIAVLLPGDMLLANAVVGHAVYWTTPLLALLALLLAARWAARAGWFRAAADEPAVGA